MPRFIARPVVVEAHRWTGDVAQLPEAFQRAVLRRWSDGRGEVTTADGPRPVKYADWLVRGSDGTVSVLSDAAFEARFAPLPAAAPVVIVPQPSKQPRKESASHG